MVHIFEVNGRGVRYNDILNGAVSLDGTSLVASEAVDFQVQDGYGSAQDVIYVSAAADGSATLTARIAAGSSGEIQTASISLTSGDDVTWTGSGSGFAGVTVGALANELGNRAITIPAGGMVSQADGSSSPEAVLRANQDAANVYLMLYPASLEEYSLDGETYQKYNQWTDSSVDSGISAYHLPYEVTRAYSADPSVTLGMFAPQPDSLS